jgi:hypothetical protein
MKSIFQIALLFVAIDITCSSVQARSMAHWPYDKLTAEADLIVIATPIAVKDTGKKTEFPGIRMTSPDNITSSVPAVEMEATFETLSILKGEYKQKDLTLRYLRVTTQMPIANGPMLVSFDPSQKMRYLLFLRRNDDGTYSSITGQVDPVHGIKELGTYP